MDRQQLMKIALLALAVVALAYVVSLYSKKQQINHSGLVDRFEGGTSDNDCVAPETLQSDGSCAENFEGGPPDNDCVAPETLQSDGSCAENFTNHSGGIQASEPAGSNEVYHQLNSNNDSGKFGLNGNQYPKDCFPKDQLSPGELLPGDANSKWAQSVPSGQGELGDQNFLTAGHHVGVNTVGQTLRNANRQLRSEPPNPQVKVSPWLQTTIETDANRRPLEIGGCA